MKKIFIVIGLFAFNLGFAQRNIINSENSWVTAGVQMGLPIGDVADISTFIVGAEIRGQHLISPNFGFGLTSGYNHFFGKDESTDMGLIPVAGFIRYYVRPEGIFGGVDLGYGFITNTHFVEGGLYLNTQLGYQNDEWNIYGYYQHTYGDDDLAIQVIGIGATYNIKF